MNNKEQKNKNPRKPKNTKKTLGRLLGYLGQYKAVLVIVLLLIVINSVANIAGVYFMAPIINNYILPGNFSGLVTSFGEGGLQFTTTQVPLGEYILFKVTYKYSSRNWTDTYKVTTTKRGYTKTLITNEDINSTDFTWNSTDNKLALNTRIVSCDQTFYDNLTNKDKNTLYVIVG